MILAVLYPFLAASFPLVFLYAKNVHEVTRQQFYTIFSKILLASSILLLSLNLYFHQLDKSAFIAFVIILFFIKSGSFYNKLIKKKIRKLKAVKIFYTFAIICLMAFSATLIGNNNSFNFTKISNYLGIFYLLITLIPLLKIIKFYSQKNYETDSSKISIIQGSTLHNHPDIYYIIVDGYTGTKALKDFLNFDNSQFTSFLKSKNFSLNQNFMANYPITNLSMAATLNMDYIENFFDYSNIDNDQDGIHKLYKHHLNNKVMLKLKMLGYKYVHIINHWEQMYFKVDENADLTIKSSGSTDFLCVFLKKTLVGIYEEDIFTATSRKNSTFLFEQLKNINEICHSISQPKFVFSHLICPHEPYLFDRNGDKPKNDATKISAYLEQVEYLNGQLQEIINNILTKSTQPPIIIIQADHGSSFLLDEKSTKAADDTLIWPKDASREMLLEKFNAFAAVHLPDSFDVLQDCRTPVNLFRIIFNKYFDGNYEILQDKQLYCHYLDNFNYSNVTHIIKGGGAK